MSKKWGTPFLRTPRMHITYLLCEIVRVYSKIQMNYMGLLYANANMKKI